MHPFETPLEAGFRALFVLAAAHGETIDLQRLAYLDYAVVHSDDLGGPGSLHPATPERRGELAARRPLIHRGVALMRSRELVDQIFGADGISYRATEAGRHVVAQFETSYAVELRRRAAWAARELAGLPDEDLRRSVEHG